MTIDSFVTFILSNFTLSFLIIGLLFSIVAIARAPDPISGAVIVEKLLSWYLFFAIGISYFYNFVAHVFFGREAAAFIGRADSLFQIEVGTASLGFSVVGFLAAWGSFDLRLGAVIPPSIFTLGAAGGHIREMVTAHNFAPGNAGVIFHTDIAIPLIGFLLLWLQWRYGPPTRSARSDFMSARRN